MGDRKEGIDTVGLVWTWIKFAFCLVQSLLIGLNILYPYGALRYRWVLAFIPVMIIWIAIHIICIGAPFLTAKFSRDMGDLLVFLVGVEDTQEYDNVN